MQMTWFLSGLRLFFLQYANANDLPLTSASVCFTFQDVMCATVMPTCPSLSIPTLSASSFALQLKFMTPQSSRWDEGRYEGEWTIRFSLTWLCAYGKSPREWKKLHLQFLAVPSNLFYGQLQCMKSQTNREGYIWQKQRHSNGPTASSNRE